MFPCDHHCRKETISCYDFFFLYSLSLTITRILGEFIARRLKLIISARLSKYKRNYGIFVQVPTDIMIYRAKWGGDFTAWVVHLCGFKGIRMQGELTVNTVALWSLVLITLRRRRRYGLCLCFMVKYTATHVLCVYFNDIHPHQRFISL